MAAVLATLVGCSEPPPLPDLELTVEKSAPPAPRAAERRPISDKKPYQINDYLIYPVKWNKVEDVAPTLQQLLQARYGAGVVVIPHIATNKLLIYLPPPQERERAGARGGSSGVRAPSSVAPRRTATRGRGTVSRGRTR